MPSHVSLDFDKVEKMREHMLVSQVQMAKLLGVSRVTYMAWVGGGVIRRKNEARVKEVLRELLAVMREHSWPDETVQALTQPQRYKKLVELMETSE